MMCDNCCIAREDIEASHRCRADESSCIDGKDCPDFVDNCECVCNEMVREEEVELVWRS